MQMQRLQKLMDSGGELIRELDDPEVRQQVGVHLRDLSSLASKAALAQRDAYGRWALHRVGRCFERAVEHVGTVTDDQAKMDETLVDTLGEVNPALLSAEAGRAYSEVLEYFLSKLYAPSKEKNFEKPGARLRVLKRLAQHPKQALAKF